MKLNELKPNTLVEHQELGIGRITKVELPQVVVAFPSEPNYQSTASKAEGDLVALPEGGLASYIYGNPEEVLSWVTDGQLRLVGATLFDLGGAGKTKELQDRLEKPVLSLVDVKWKTWWDKVQPSLKESEHFEFQTPHTYCLKEGVLVEHIPVQPLASKAKPQKSSSSPSGETIPALNFLDAVDLLRASLTANLKQQQDAHAAELRQQGAFHAAELKQLRDAHTAELRQQLQLQRDAHTAELRQQMDSHTADLKQQRDSHTADLKQQRDSHTADLKQQRDSHTADLDRWKQEEERLYNRIQNLVADRKESRLDIRRDMLEAMAVTLKILRQGQGDLASLLRDAEAGLKLALQAGEAQFYGETNQLVEYDPELHEATEDLARGETVTIVHPGAFIPGSKTGNYILLKAQVQRRPEGNR